MQLTANQTRHRAQSCWVDVGAIRAASRQPSFETSSVAAAGGLATIAGSESSLTQGRVGA